METEIKFKNYTLRYKGLGNCDCKCGVLMWYAFHKKKKVPCAPAIVLMIELVDNTGTSVTNYSPHIAEMIVQKENLPPLDTLFFEVQEKDMAKAERAGSMARKVEDAVDSVSYDVYRNGVLYSSPQWRYFGTQKFKDVVKELFGVVFGDDFISNIKLEQPALNEI